MVKEKSWSPDRGDILWLKFDPQAGRGQTGYQPVLVISPRLYNSRVGLALLCPITASGKDYPFEVPLPEGLLTTGVILADQFKSLDWRASEAVFKEKAPEPVINEVLARLSTLVS